MPVYSVSAVFDGEEYPLNEYSTALAFGDRFPTLERALAVATLPKAWTPAEAVHVYDVTAADARCILSFDTREEALDAWRKEIGT